QKTYNEKPPLTPPRPPLTPPKEGNKKMPPREANNSPPSEGSGVVSYRLAKRSIKLFAFLNCSHVNFLCCRLLTYRKAGFYALESRNL
ncbi:MAG: hypothetical protein LBC74_07300, partial [Planctomycetaceae bacterium]|nr:hypothetical protein [Planctomycetaceae bacterium]